MTIWRCYGRGVKAAGARPQVSVFLWLFNLILAGLVAYVFAPPFGS
jgi:hypothetical protein